LKFKPERYASRGENKANVLPEAAFGYGRRMCPGRFLAFDSLWLSIASVLSVYDISKAVDETGSPIEPDLEYTSSILSHPKPFKCQIVPRSEAATAVIHRTANA